MLHDINFVWLVLDLHFLFFSLALSFHSPVICHDPPQIAHSIMHPAENGVNTDSLDPGDFPERNLLLTQQPHKLGCYGDDSVIAL